MNEVIVIGKWRVVRNEKCVWTSVPGTSDTLTRFHGSKEVKGSRNTGNGNNGCMEQKEVQKILDENPDMTAELMRD